MTTKDFLSMTTASDIDGYVRKWLFNDSMKQVSAYIANRTMGLGFSGTIGSIFPPSKDWIEDLKVNKKSFSVGSTRYKAHAGFVQEYMEMRDVIFDLIRSSLIVDVYVAGFSKGGAHATLCVRDLLENFPNLVVTSHTFASPRVYDERSSAEFDLKLNERKTTSFTRHVVLGDPVPHLPIWLMGYQHTHNHVNYGKYHIVNDDASLHSTEVYGSYL